MPKHVRRLLRDGPRASRKGRRAVLAAMTTGCRVEVTSRSAPLDSVASVRPLRVLALTHRVPYPPDKGDKIRTYNLLTRLARRAEVHLLCLADPPEDRAHLPSLRCCFASVDAVPLRSALQKLRALPYLVTRVPLTLPVFRSTSLERAVDALVARVKPDVIYAESSSMAPYALRHPHVPLVMDFVDVDSAKWRACAARGSPIMRLVYAREAWTLARYEREVASRAAISTLTAERELTLFHALAPGARARVLENGVDTEYYAPRARTPEKPSLVFFGAMDYLPNVEAAIYLVEAVLPRLRERVPAVTVTLAGAHPAREVVALGRVPGVTVTGHVADIRPCVQAAALSVCPLRVARGVQNKILEAMAMGVPVVASPAAAEGIDAVAGRDLVVAPDEPSGEAMAVAIAKLLTDRDSAEALARAARARVTERYGWQPRADELYELLAEAASMRGNHSLRR